jgi:hypothetical protein
MGFEHRKVDRKYYRQFEREAGIPRLCKAIEDFEEENTNGTAL